MPVWPIGTLDQTISQKMDNAVDNEIDLGRTMTKKEILVDIISLILGFLLIIGMWWAVGSIYNSFFSYSMKFPMPEEVFEDLFSLLDGETVFTFTIWEHLSASLKRWVIGFGIATVIGIILGLLISANRVLYKILIIPINALQMIPGLAWLPVVMILFGFGDKSAMFIVGIVAIAPIAINISNGLRNVPTVNRRVAKMSGLSRWDIFLEVMLPFSVLDIITGLRVGLGSSWRMIIAAEMVVGVMKGIGFTMKGASDTLDYTTSFACIIIICVIGIIIDRVLFDTLERTVRKTTGVGDV